MSSGGRGFEEANLFRDSSHHSVTGLCLAVRRRHLCVDMVLSDSMGFSFHSSWCLVGRSCDRGRGMSETEALGLCVCVHACVLACMHACVSNDGAFFTEDDSRRAVIN